MGNSGGYIVFGVLMLVMIPLIMSAIGNTFEQSINEKASIEGDTDSFLLSFGLWLQSKSDVIIFGGFFEFLGFMFLGYSIFAWWINVILITIPIILIARGVASATA